MRYLALVTDYDGTLAEAGQVAPRTVAMIERLRASGRRAILVTGRRLDELLAIFPRSDLFDYIVAENGALAYAPRTREITLLGKPPPPEFMQRLAALGVERLEAGQVLVATWVPHHIAVLQVIRELGLELLIMFNRDAVMVLPPGVNKATGLDYALRKLGLSLHETVGVGNAENDHSFLERCECAVAVANAVPSIRKLAAFVTQFTAGAGIAELIEELLGNDLARTNTELERRRIVIGSRPDGELVTLPPYGINVLVAGPSGSGKSTITAGIVERLIEQDYQVCIVDPEGDYGGLQEVITLGTERRAISLNEALSVLEDPKVNLNINLLGIPLEDRPAYFAQLYPNLLALRTRTARPHWIVLDEAHHMLPIEGGPLREALPHALGETLLVSVHPNHLPPEILSLIDVVIAVGKHPEATLRKFAAPAGYDLQWPDELLHRPGRVVVWFPRGHGRPFAMNAIPPRRDRIRHRRKYVEGNMRAHSFFFRGPGERHNIRAHNLAIFSQIAEGIDEETWLYHLRRGDYSRWFRHAVKDRYLADQAERLERRTDLSSGETRDLMRRLIESRYTLPE
jgi:hydroxymethylpyrimidine pyrophosphatase-like HAD family hydrolase